MKYALLIFVFLFFINADAQTAKDLADAWDEHHITKIAPSNMRHADLKKQLEQLKELGLKVQEVGRSYANREIYQVEWGTGATRIFMWSQMHGDEPTATPALIDMFAFLQKKRNEKWVKELEKNLTIRAVPMLNPDGAEIFQRRSLLDVDINRDAQNLQTPEAQLLKKLRDEWSPEIGFNLHNQQALTTVGGTYNQAAISFLVVRGDPEIKFFEAGHERNKRLVGAMTIALQNFIRGHIGRYVDDYTPTAFGDKFSDWGTPVILIETGALDGKDEMFLVKMNFIAYLSAFKALADGSEKNLSPMNYDFIPNNSSGNLSNFVFRRANIINRAKPEEILVGDIALNKQRRRAAYSAPTHIRAIGDLPNLKGLEEYDASNFYVVPRFDTVRVGAGGELLFYKKTRSLDWKAENLEKDFPPDAIFSLGKWATGEKVLQKIK
jgi:hypothetical protein